MEYSSHKVLDGKDNKMNYNYIQEHRGFLKTILSQRNQTQKECILYDSNYIKLKTKLIHAVNSQKIVFGRGGW